MGLFSFLGVLSPVQMGATKMFSRTKFIGQDSDGNKYYTAKARKGYKRERRWVMYKGKAEATKIPPEWHGWMHHQTNVVPDSNVKSFRRKWQKPHSENLTGTKAAYRPPGHLLQEGQRPKTTGDYEAWSPTD